MLQTSYNIHKVKKRKEKRHWNFLKMFEQHDHVWKVTKSICKIFVLLKSNHVLSSDFLYQNKSFLCAVLERSWAFSKLYCGLVLLMQCINPRTGILNEDKNCAFIQRQLVPPPVCLKYCSQLQALHSYRPYFSSWELVQMIPSLGQYAQCLVTWFHIAVTNLD